MNVLPNSKIRILRQQVEADILFALGSPETWHALVIDRGWTQAAFADWYAETLERQLLR